MCVGVRAIRATYQGRVRFRGPRCRSVGQRESVCVCVKVCVSVRMCVCVLVCVLLGLHVGVSRSVTEMRHPSGLPTCSPTRTQSNAHAENIFGILHPTALCIQRRRNPARYILLFCVRFSGLNAKTAQLPVCGSKCLTLFPNRELLPIVS